MDKDLSKTFSFLRFPLAVMVVALHVLPMPFLTIGSIVGGTFPIEEKIFDIIYVLGIKFCNLAVPTFFFISGYLLFVKRADWSIGVYSGIMYKKARTLLIPYIFWNIVGFLYLYFTRQSDSFSFWHAFVTGPENFPLWFIRNLIVLMAISPLIYIAIKKLGNWSLLAVILLYVLPCYPPNIRSLYIPVSFTFFYFGCNCGYLKLDMSNTFLRFRSWKYILPLMAGLLLICNVISDSGYNSIIYNTYIVLGVISIIIIASWLTNKIGLVVPLWLSSAGFFIYVTHKIGPTFIVKKLISLVVPENYYDLAVFLTAPLIVALLCSVAYWILKRIFPAFLFFTSGLSKSEFRNK